MEDLVEKILPVLQLLLPGFITTSVYYWLADAKKPNEFERVLQALICTTIIAIVSPLIELALIWAGNYISFGTLTPPASEAVKLISGALFGIILAANSNNDIIYKIARRMKITSKSSTEDRTYFLHEYGYSGSILHFHDGNRLMGHLVAFPSDENGHFVIEKPYWIANGKKTRYAGIHQVIVSEKDVRWIEIIDIPGAQNGKAN